MSFLQAGGNQKLLDAYRDANVPEAWSAPLASAATKRSSDYFSGKYDHNVADAYRLRLRALRGEGLVEPPADGEDW
jgi:hypothetical protein